MHVTIAPGVRLFVDIQGPSLVPDGPVMREKPTLVLLHGGPGYDHSGFKPAFSRLADIAQIVYYDHRGHGRSDRRPADEWTLDTFADDVVRLCDALGIVKPIVLGQSFGGFVAQRYIERHPAHAAKVVLSSTSPHMGLPRKLAMFERLGGREARDVAERFWTQPNETTWAEYERVCKQHYNTARPANDDASRRIVFNTDILFTSARGEQQSMNLLPGLSRAQCPVLVMAGELDPVCPLDDARATLPPRSPRSGCSSRASRTRATAPGATNPTRPSRGCASSCFSRQSTTASPRRAVCGVCPRHLKPACGPSARGSTSASSRRQ